VASYGLSTMLLNLGNLAVFLSILMLDQYLIRKGNEDDVNLLKLVLSITRVYVFLLPFVLIGEVILFSHIFLEQSSLFIFSYILYVFSLGFLQIDRARLFVEKRYTRYYLITTLILVLWILIIAFIFLIGINIDLEKIILIMSISLVLIIIFEFADLKITEKVSLTKFHLPFKETISILKKGISYSLWLIPFFLMEKTMVLSDKFFITKFLDNYYLGIYALSTIFPSIVFSFIAGITEAAKNKFFSGAYTKKTSYTMLKVIFSSYLVILPYTIFNKDMIISIISNQELSTRIPNSLLIIAILVGLCNSIWVMMNFVAQSKYQTKLFGVFSIVGIFLNIILNAIFVTIFGLFGVAIATLISITVCILPIIILLGQSKLALVSLFSSFRYFLVSFAIMYIVSAISNQYMYFIICSVAVAILILNVLANHLKDNS
jgi:O-antigen/teichoic acid export membrane protein